MLKGNHAVASIKAAADAGDVTLNYGLFVNTILNFLIVAFVLFLLLRQINKLKTPPPETSSTEPPEGHQAAARNPRFAEGGAAVRPAILLALALTAFAGRAVADDAAALRAAAENFYGVYKTFHPSDGIPDDAGLARYRPVLSPRLGALLGEAGEAQKRYAAANKELPTPDRGRYSSPRCSRARPRSRSAPAPPADPTGRCTATLSYAPPGSAPTRWTDTVYLANTPEGWRVDDIGYGGTWDFGNKGRLSLTLAQVLHFQ